MILQFQKIWMKKNSKNLLIGIKIREGRSLSPLLNYNPKLKLNYSLIKHGLRNF